MWLVWKMRWILPLLLTGALLVMYFLYVAGVYESPQHNKLKVAQHNNLNGAQHAFSVAFSQLIIFAQDLGYSVSIDACYRPRDTRSLHGLRLACDLRLFKDGHYLRGTEDYRHLGTWWIKYGHNYGIPLEWGGSAKRDDGDHFSHGWRGRW